MSYDIYLTDPVTKETLHTDTPHQIRGGTYAMSGTTEMWLNITYNYADWYYMPEVFGENGIRTIYGMSGAESIRIIDKAISALESMDKDLSVEEIADYEAHKVTGYWIPTRANALRPLYQLKAMAQMRPDGIWDGD